MINLENCLKVDDGTWLGPEMSVRFFGFSCSSLRA